MTTSEKYPNIYTKDNQPKIGQEVEAYYMWTGKFEKGIYKGCSRANEAMIQRHGEDGVITVFFSNIK